MPYSTKKDLEKFLKERDATIEQMGATLKQMEQTIEQMGRLEGADQGKDKAASAANDLATINTLRTIIGWVGINLDVLPPGAESLPSGDAVENAVGALPMCGDKHGLLCEEMRALAGAIRVLNNRLLADGATIADLKKRLPQIVQAFALENIGELDDLVAWIPESNVLQPGAMVNQIKAFKEKISDNSVAAGSPVTVGITHDRTMRCVVAYMFNHAVFAIEQKRLDDEKKYPVDVGDGTKQEMTQVEALFACLEELAHGAATNICTWYNEEHARTEEIKGNPAAKKKAKEAIAPQRGSAYREKERLVVLSPCIQAGIAVNNLVHGRTPVLKLKDVCKIDIGSHLEFPSLNPTTLLNSKGPPAYVAARMWRFATHELRKEEDRIDMGTFAGGKRLLEDFDNDVYGCRTDPKVLGPPSKEDQATRARNKKQAAIAKKNANKATKQANRAWGAASQARLSEGAAKRASEIAHKAIQKPVVKKNPRQVVVSAKIDGIPKKPAVATGDSGASMMPKPKGSKRARNPDDHVDELLAAAKSHREEGSEEGSEEESEEKSEEESEEKSEEESEEKSEEESEEKSEDGSEDGSESD